MRERARWYDVSAAVICAALAIGTCVWFALSGTQERQRQFDSARALTAGDPGRGKHLITSSGCGACHQIKGIPAARGKVASPLDGVGARAVIGGTAANTPANLARWIEDPRALNPATAVPKLGLTERDARDIAAYLYANR